MFMYIGAAVSVAVKEAIIGGLVEVE